LSTHEGATEEVIMAKKKHYEYNESSSYDYVERDKARHHKMKPNDRWRYNPAEVLDGEDGDDYDEDEYLYQ
jgi:hypothetical protein